MKKLKCPHCAEEDLQVDANVCKHCGYNIKENSSPGTNLLGVIFIIFGFFFWPLWIIAILLFILAAANRRR